MIVSVRRRALLPFAAACLYATQANAQVIVDGSGAEIPDSIRQEVFDLVTENFRDPLSSQFRRLHRASKADRYCGEVNTRNMYGAYAGFKPFVVVLEPELKSVEVVPSDDFNAKVREATLKEKLGIIKTAGCRVGPRWPASASSGAPGSVAPERN